MFGFKKKEDKGFKLFKAFYIDGDDNVNVSMKEEVFFPTVKEAMEDLFRWNKHLKEFLTLDKLSELTGKQFSIMTINCGKIKKGELKPVTTVGSGESHGYLVSLIEDSGYEYRLDDYLLTHIKLFIPNDGSSVDVEYYKMAPIQEDDEGQYIETSDTEAMISVTPEDGCILSTF